MEIYAPETDGRYGRPAVYAAGDRVQVGIFTDLAIDLGAVFAEP